jgi:hypothetical protein
MDSANRRADFSNYGSCVDLYAPGSNVESASSAADDQSTRGSGTSFAAPLVTGTLAQMLQQNPNLTPAQLQSRLLGEATLNAVTDVKGGPNRLLFTNVKPPGLPSGQRAVPTGPRSVRVSWVSPPQTDIASFDVYRNGARVATVSGASTGWTDTGVAPTTHYGYGIVATNYYGQNGPSTGWAWTWTPGDRTLAPPLWRYWNSIGSDHFYSITRNDAGYGYYGYTLERPEARIYSYPAGDMVPLYRYFNGSSTDHLYTVDRDDAGWAQYGYSIDQVEGYVYRYHAAGTVPLYRDWNWQRTDHFYPVDRNDAAYAASGWAFERIEAYVFPF